MRTTWTSGGLLRSHETLNPGCPTAQLAKTHASEVAVLLEAFPPDDDATENAKANPRTLSLADALIDKARGLGLLPGDGGGLGFLGDEHDDGAFGNVLPMRAQGRALIASQLATPFDAAGHPAAITLQVVDTMTGQVQSQATYACVAPIPHVPPREPAAPSPS